MVGPLTPLNLVCLLTGLYQNLKRTKEVSIAILICAGISVLPVTRKHDAYYKHMYRMHLYDMIVLRGINNRGNAELKAQVAFYNICSSFQHCGTLLSETIANNWEAFLDVIAFITFIFSMHPKQRYCTLYSQHVCLQVHAEQYNKCVHFYSTDFFTVA